MHCLRLTKSSKLRDSTRLSAGYSIGLKWHIKGSWKMQAKPPLGNFYTAYDIQSKTDTITSIIEPKPRSLKWFLNITIYYKIRNFWI